jgi:hypothetical protein
MKRIVQGGREFHCGSCGTCQVVLWHQNGLCYALVGKLQRDDIRDMARRAAKTLEAAERERTGADASAAAAR